MAWLIGCMIVATIFYFSRKAGIVVVALLAMVWIGLWLVTERKGEQQASNQSISITASSEQQACPDPARPISVNITNNAGRSLENVSFSLVARQRGSSSIIYRASHTSDESVAPGETFSACFELNPLSFAIRTIQYDIRELDWSAEISLTRFASR